MVGFPKLLKNRWVKVLFAIMGGAALVLLALLLYITITEYRPAEREEITAAPGSEILVSRGLPITMVSWNIGYGGLGSDADFFMDGGKQVNPRSEQAVRLNLEGISGHLEEIKPEIILLQEVDSGSRRSFGIDERKIWDGKPPFGQGFYGLNHKAFVPYPWPMIGKVSAGLYTNSLYRIEKGERIQLPVPFKWPVRAANMKRCLLITRLPVEGETKELVVINLHMEAYDDSGGREAQTARLMEIAEAEFNKGNYVIAGGDWNQSFVDLDESYAEKGWVPGRLEEKGLPAGWRLEKGSEGVATCRLLDRSYIKKEDKEASTLYHIDGYLVSPNVAVNRVETLDLGFQFSDHNPVVLEFSL